MLKNFESISAELLSYDNIYELSHLPNLLLVILTLLLLWLGKKVFSVLSPFSLEHQLVKTDNKAVAIAFVGYLGGVSVILEGVLEGGESTLLQDIYGVTLWGVIGIVLLNLAGAINNKFILHRFDNQDEILNQHNLGVGAVMAGSYIGSAMIIRSILIGEGLGLLFDIILTLFYFFIAQFTFYLYSLLYQKTIQYDFQDELSKGNTAAGISFGMNLAAMGVLLAIPLSQSFSLVLFFAWFVIGSAVMAFFRYVMDRIIIPLEKLDMEIYQDKNWGVALLEGCFSITAVVTLQQIFL